MRAGPRSECHVQSALQPAPEADAARRMQHSLHHSGGGGEDVEPSGGK